MSITLTLSPEEIAQIKRLTRVENDAEAVLTAAREFVRLSHLSELKAASGRVEFENNWEKLEALELREREVPE